MTQRSFVYGVVTHAPREDLFVKDVELRQTHFEPHTRCSIIYTSSALNVPTAGAQVFMDYPLGQRAITHYAVSVRTGGLNVPSSSR
jgi:hypothetical protein